MKNYKPAMSFGKDVAAGDPDRLRGDEGATVAFLHELAGDGPVLELAIGTGRIARSRWRSRWSVWLFATTAIGWSSREITYSRLLDMPAIWTAKRSGCT